MIYLKKSDLNQTVYINKKEGYQSPNAVVVLQSKDIKLTSPDTTEITTDEGYTALDKVTVTPVLEEVKKDYNSQSTFQSLLEDIFDGDRGFLSVKSSDGYAGIKDVSVELPMLYGKGDIEDPVVIDTIYIPSDDSKMYDINVWGMIAPQTPFYMQTDMFQVSVDDLVDRFGAGEEITLGQIMESYSDSGNEWAIPNPELCTITLPAGGGIDYNYIGSVVRFSAEKCYCDCAGDRDFTVDEMKYVISMLGSNSPSTTYYLWYNSVDGEDMGTDIENYLKSDEVAAKLEKLNIQLYYE